jgi:hypothetical protein
LEPTTDPEAAKDEQEVLEAYARWRIMLINTITGSQDAMQIVYQTLQEKFPEESPGHSYAVIASEFWKYYQITQDINAACAKANSAAKEQDLYPSQKPENICFVP